MDRVFRLKDSKKIHPSSKIFFQMDDNKHAMIISKASLAESGSYQVRAYNVAGDATVNFGLKIKGRLAGCFHRLSITIITMLSNSYLLSFIALEITIIKEYMFKFNA